MFFFGCILPSEGIKMPDQTPASIGKTQQGGPFFFLQSEMKENICLCVVVCVFKMGRAPRKSTNRDEYTYIHETHGLPTKGFKAL